MPDDSLWTAYANTRLLIGRRPRIKVDLRLPVSDELRHLLTKLGLGATFAIVTPCRSAGRASSCLAESVALYPHATAAALRNLRFVPADGESPRLEASRARIRDRDRSRQCRSARARARAARALLVRWQARSGSMARSQSERPSAFPETDAGLPYVETISSAIRAAAPGACEKNSAGSITSSSINSSFPSRTIPSTRA